MLFSCLLLALFAGTCSAETTYQVTETELTRLDQIFDRLQTNNNQLLTDLQESKTDLTTVQLQLEEYQTELVTLQNQLQQLKTESTQAKQSLLTAQASLVKANISLQVYEQEVKSETRKLKAERDIGYLAAIFFAIRK